METIKPWYTSKTVISAFIGAVSTLLSMFGIVDISANEQNELAKWVASLGITIIQLVSYLSAIFFRINAKAELK